MADEAELDIGIKFDEEQFTSAYNRFLSRLSQSTSTFIQAAMDDMKGAAAKSWSTLPFNQMHTSTGNRYATAAFLPSFAEDLKKMGLSQSSEAYNSALMSATYRSSIADVAQRRNFLQAQGMNTLSPDSVYERVLNTDYTLMSQPWARYFLKTHKHKGIDEEELKKLKVSELKSKAATMGLNLGSKALKADYISAIVEASQKATATFDFAGMREEAVKTGLGRWIDPEGKHTAENFELLEKTEDEIEKINNKSKETKQTFSDWSDILKGTLGTLTALGKVTVKAAGVGLIVEKVAEKTVENAAKSMDSRRGILDMSVSDVLETKVAGKAVGLSEDTIFNDIEKLSSNRAEYLTLGKGLDPLYSSLQGTFDILATEEDPYERYKKMVSRVYSDLKGADAATRQRDLMYLDKQGLGSIAYLAGAFLSNPELAKQYSDDPIKLFALRYNPYREGAYGRAEQINAEMQPLKESIKTSYTELADLWMESFGTPFLGWWDKFLQNQVIPWFSKATKKPTEQEEFETGAAVWALTNSSKIDAIVSDRNRVIKSNTWGKNVAALGGEYWGMPFWDMGTHTMSYRNDDPRAPYYITPKTKLPRWSKEHDYLNDWFGGIKATTAEGVQAQWRLFEKFAHDYKEKDFEGRPDLLAVWKRAKEITSLYKDKALDDILLDKQFDFADIPLLKYAQMALFGENVRYGDKTFNSMDVLKAMVEDALSKGIYGANTVTGDDRLVELMTKLNLNAEQMRAIMETESMRAVFENVGGIDYYKERQMTGIGRQ